MMTGDILKWKTNPEWYDYDENDEPFLTEKAPVDAHESFQKYLEAMKQMDETGVRTI